MVGSDGLLDARFALGGFGQPAAPSGYTLDIALPQVEIGAFASSWIRTSASPATRDLDRVVIGAASVPAWLRGGSFVLDIEPVFESTELATVRQRFVLFEFGAADQWLGLESDGSGQVLLVAQAGVQRTVLALPAFARGQRFTLTVSPEAGELTTTLAQTVATGPSWRWPALALSVGARGAGARA